MKILDMYIAAVVTAGTGIALLMVVGLDTFFSIISQIDNLEKGSYNAVRMLQYVALDIPRAVYELFPMAALLGSLMGMGMMANNSELVAMRASGMSAWRIVRAVLNTGVLMLVLVVALGELVAPAAEEYARQMRAQETQKRIGLGRHGLWVRDANLFVNVERILSDNQLGGLTVYEFGENSRLEVETRASHAEFQDNRWLMYGVRQSILDQDTVRVRHLDSLGWSSLITPNLLDIVMLKPENMSTHDIRQYVAYMDENGLDTRQYRYAFWSRLTTPVSALVMLFISVPFMFGGLRSVGMGQRVFIGILIGFGYYLASQLGSQLGQVYDLNPALTSIAPSLVFLLFGILAMQRI